MTEGTPEAGPARRRQWLVVVGSSIGGSTAAAVDPELAARTVTLALASRKHPAIPAQAGPDDREAA